jgi:hypothetical protein
MKKGWRPPQNGRFSHMLQDLLNRLLAAKPNARPQSAASVMRHPWFGGLDWAALREGRMKAPYVPSERRRGRPTVPASAPPAEALDALQAGDASGPPPASPGGARLATVLERAPSGGAEHKEGGEAGHMAPQRSAVSGHLDGSVRHGREGLVRDGGSFETALDTLPAHEARALIGAAAEEAAAARLVAAGGANSGPSGSGGGSHAGSQHGSQHGAAPSAMGHRHTHSNMNVRFAADIGVAKCA